MAEQTSQDGDTPENGEEARRARRIRPTGQRRRPRSRRRKILLAAAWTAAGGILVGGAGLGFAYVKLNGNLEGVDINAALGSDRPEEVDDGSLDLLVLGSDSRSGDNGKYGRDEGAARSDTAMIVHLHEGRKKATVVSIPRDTLVTRPDCAAEDGSTVSGGQRQMFNTAYEAGGPACAVKTVEQMSGIRMDHYLEVDFSGFQEIIDRLGGVEVTTGKAIDDDKSGLHLDKGTHTLDGEQSLGLVRTRHGVGDGSDLGRIQLQQTFLTALMHRVQDLGLLSSPKKLYGVADAATKSLTTDAELDSVPALLDFAQGLKGLKPEGMEMLTLPVEYDPADANRVLPQEKAGAQVWKALRADKAVPASATEGSAGDKGDVDDVVSAG
ncbi:LCP family protein [Streptomyces albidoflavus]